MGWRRPPHPWVSGHSTRRGLCSFTSGQEMNPFYSISNFSLFVYITLFNVYCQTDRFLLKVYLLPPSLAVCPGWGRGSWCGGGRFSPGIPPGPGSGAEAFARAVAASAGTVAAARSCPFRCCALRPPGGAAAGRRAGSGGGGGRRLPAAPLVVPAAGARNGRRRLAQGPRRRRRHGPGVQVRATGSPPPSAWPALGVRRFPRVAARRGGGGVWGTKGGGGPGHGRPRARAGGGSS